MSASSFTVTGMTCGHCVSSVTEEVGGLPGVSKVDVDLTTGLVTVTSAAPLDEAQIRTAVEAAGYQLTSA
ncbi:MAG: hypothetical protein JWM02_2374 [Frankiales bacterium]|nr:hypothetical protein [Frankiales bacterium]